MKGKLSTSWRGPVYGDGRLQGGHPMKSITQDLHLGLGHDTARAAVARAVRHTRDKVVLSRNGRTHPTPRSTPGHGRSRSRRMRRLRSSRSSRRSSPPRSDGLSPRTRRTGAGPKIHGRLRRDKTLSLALRPGVTYTGGEQIVARSRPSCGSHLPPEAATRTPSPRRDVAYSTFTTCHLTPPPNKRAQRSR